MPAIVTNTVQATGNLFSNHSVLIWKMFLGTLKIITGAVVVTIAGADWGSMSRTQHVLAICGGLSLVATNIESLITNINQPKDSSETLSGMPPINPAPEVPTVIKPVILNPIIK